ncbi:iron-containing redox enzyme family protein [Streptomyces sp. NBC_00576]|uniref:iron-containing redox enzyme family protein n=1 Tax=Streptomyces sp. NBC_00576 TaxID=2903665 RepID=UPI002E81714D|nr:iron-containing redox enzyme family protein [Streptomyces sp. NBC_00576]WUB73415.1 iron-containing redox enzyme family protein [Streptomyces sp. NBC_00576]
MSAFTLPDTFVVAPLSTSEFDPATGPLAAEVIAAGPESVYHRLVSDQESEVVFLLARHVLNGFLGASGSPTAQETREPGADGIAERTAQVGRQITEMLQPLREAEPRVRDAVLAQRAPLALIGGCWLDSVSQPATQPATVVNQLVRHQFVWRGEGNPRRSLQQLRTRALEGTGVFLPDVTAQDFLRQAQARPLTSWHGAYCLSLAKLSATFLPEVVGTHYVMAALGVDELLLGTRPLLTEAELRATLADYLALASPPVRSRLYAAVTRTLAMEMEHGKLLADVAEWHAGLSLDAQVAQIVARHAPFAGKQHRSVRVGGRPLTERFADPDSDLAAFIADFRASPQMKSREGGCRFVRAIKFGGPMFGIFDEREAATFQRWAEAIAAGDPPDIELIPNTAGDDVAHALAETIRATPPGIQSGTATRDDEREFLHRLVNIENFPNTLAIARANAEEGLARAEILFEHGDKGILTDASWFEYSPSALNERVDRIYWDKLVNPYQPLTELPDRDEVVFGQTTFALGSMIDGAWAHRIGATGRYTRRSDGMLYSIYADEMGRGDIGKNHITLIYQVLASLGIKVPHLRDTAFLDQDELPDHLYGFSLFQLSLALFPDSLYDEILGYNLGIEMFGLGTMRMHEMQKLRHHGFDVAYEEAHLSIDNLSAGHARQSAEIVIAYLHDVEKVSGADAVPSHWRRIWRGYASFAYFVEHELVAGLTRNEPVDVVI